MRHKKINAREVHFWKFNACTRRLFKFIESESWVHNLHFFACSSYKWSSKNTKKLYCFKLTLIEFEREFFAVSRSLWDFQIFKRNLMWFNNSANYCDSPCRCRLDPTIWYSQFSIFNYKICLTFTNFSIVLYFITLKPFSWKIIRGLARSQIFIRWDFVTKNYFSVCHSWAFQLICDQSLIIVVDGLKKFYTVKMLCEANEKMFF